MNDHLTALRAAYVTQMQRAYRVSSRGIPTPEQHREWAYDANALIAAHDRETAARAWDEGAKAAWESSGEGWNGEYPVGIEHDVPNPYREEAT